MVKRKATIAELREADRAARDENKALARQITELRATKDSVVQQGRVASAIELFKDYECPPEWASLYLSDQGDDAEVNDKAVRQWLIQTGLPSPKLEGFTPGGVQNAEMQGPKRVTRKELDDIMYSDPQRAARLIDEGLIDWGVNDAS